MKFGEALPRSARRISSWSEGPLGGGANDRADMQGVEGKRVAALIGDGFEEAELSEPRRALEEAGAIVTIVGVDERSRQRIRGKRGLDEGQSVRAEELVADCTAEDFDALLIPGGTSPDRIRTNHEVQRFVREFDALKKPMFSIGHGGQVLISSQIVRGRQLTGVHSIADDIRNAGGLYRDQPTVIDSNWVSTRGSEDLAQFNRAMLEKLATAMPAQIGS
jgi:protease I